MTVPDNVSLIVLNALTKELNDVIAGIEANLTMDKEVLIVEYSKAYGLAANLSAEALAVSNDLAKLIGKETSAQQPTTETPQTTNLLTGLFGKKNDERN